MKLTRLRRTMDAALINKVANHDSVRPHLGMRDMGALDFSAAVANPDNVCLVNATGGWIFEKHGPGCYEGHSMFLPEGRGKPMIADAHEAIRWMFSRTDCLELQAKIPDDNRAVKGLAWSVGFQEVFRMESGPLGPCSFQKITLDRWICRDKSLPVIGQQFHAGLDDAIQGGTGKRPGAHPDEEAHDRAVGAAMMMVLAGNPRKGVWAYNRWARLAGYWPITLLSETPPVLDVRDAIVGVSNGAMEVFSCQERRSQG